MNTKYDGKSAGLTYTLASTVPTIFNIVIMLVVQVLLLSFGSDNIDGVTGNKYYIWMTLFVNQMGLLFVVYFMTRRSRVNFALATGLKKRPDAEYLGLGLAATISLLFLLSPVVRYMVEGLQALGYRPITSSVPAVDSWGSFFMSVFLLALLPALFEESVYRGMLLGGLKEYGGAFAVLISALLFMLMHQNIEQTVYQFSLGLLLGYVAVRTGSVLIPMVMHFTSNFAVLLMEFIANLMGVGGAGPLVSGWEWVAMAIGGAALAVIVLYEFAVKRRKRPAADSAQETGGAAKPAFSKAVMFAYAGFGIGFNLLMFFLQLFGVFA